MRLCTSSVIAATGQRWSETGATLNNSDCCHACHTSVLPLIPCHYVFLCHALKSTVQTCLGWTSGLLADEETKSVVQAQAMINKQRLTCHLCQWQGHLTTYVTLTDSLSHRTYGSLLACLTNLEQTALKVLFALDCCTLVITLDQPTLTCASTYM